MYQFSIRHSKLSPVQIWLSIQNGLSKDVTIKSIRDKIPYVVNYIKEEAISFSAATRNNGAAEIITKNDFLKVVSLLLKENTFNTSSTKELFRGTKIYRKRSPMFALLLSSSVIEKAA